MRSSFHTESDEIKQKHHTKSHTLILLLSSCTISDFLSHTHSHTHTHTDTLTLTLTLTHTYSHSHSHSHSHTHTHTHTKHQQRQVPPQHVISTHSSQLLRTATFRSEERRVG